MALLHSKRHNDAALDPVEVNRAAQMPRDCSMQQLAAVPFRRSRQVSTLATMLTPYDLVIAFGNSAGNVEQSRIVGESTVLQRVRCQFVNDERQAGRCLSPCPIRGTATRMRPAKLASQLLAFVRRQPHEPKIVNVRKLIQNMDAMLRRALGEEIALETVISGGLWNTLIDPGQLENAILNLAINTRDAMEGRGRLTIEIASSILDDDYARLHEDVRPGRMSSSRSLIPAQAYRLISSSISLNRLSARRRKGKGSGLGLSMVYGFLNQSGGHLKIYSEVGDGTTMKLYMPRTMQTEDSWADANAIPAKGGTETVLVVKDDDAVREISVAPLTDLGYRFLKAHNAQYAFAIVNRGIPIDLLFTDVVMPGPMRSTERARRAKALLPDIGSALYLGIHCPEQRATTQDRSGTPRA